MTPSLQAALITVEGDSVNGEAGLLLKLQTLITKHSGYACGNYFCM